MSWGLYARDRWLRLHGTAPTALALSVVTPSERCVSSLAQRDYELTTLGLVRGCFSVTMRGRPLFYWGRNRVCRHGLTSTYTSLGEACSGLETFSRFVSTRLLISRLPSGPTSLAVPPSDKFRSIHAIFDYYFDSYGFTLIGSFMIQEYHRGMANLCGVKRNRWSRSYAQLSLLLVEPSFLPPYRSSQLHRLPVKVSQSLLS
ncbi:hypothetical protein VNO77_16962 [Canavalia gladiata]|uniref:Uncharacterized protein n=1 Tax=Canavalia gladiata TaxID=3824 RepID=A0AAN9LID5_CANGL